MKEKNNNNNNNNNNIYGHTPSTPEKAEWEN